MAKIADIAAAIEDIRKGRMVILVDDENRENEGDLVCAAEKVTPQLINFMITHARGLVCVPLPEEKLDALALPPMTQDNRAPLGTAFTVSVDAVGMKSGISAKGRSTTTQTLMRDDVTLADLKVPGHIFPLRARKGGVLVRAGQTEGGVDLTRLAGLKPGAVICEIMNPDGSMMRLDGLLEFGEQHGLKVVTIEDLIAYRMQKELFVRPVAEVDLPTDYGVFRCIAYENELDTHVHIAMVLGDVRVDEPTLVRVHRADLVCDVFGFTGDSTQNRLDWSMRRIAEEGRGVVLYLRSAASGEMAIDSLTRWMHRHGKGTQKPASAAMNFREFGLGAQILSDLGLRQLRIITSSPNVPFTAVRGFGLKIVERVPITDDSDAGKPVEPPTEAMKAVTKI